MKTRSLPLLLVAALCLTLPALAADPPAAPTSAAPTPTAPARGDAAKADGAQGDSAQGDSAQGDSAKGDSAKGDSAKADAAPGAAKSDAADPDDAAPDAAKSGAANTADPPAAAVSKGAAASGARVLFEAGAKAYSAGNYRAAIQAFEQAYGVEARPGLLFSMAQAHRRQYSVDGRAGHVAVAIRRYEEYLHEQHRGGRRSDAEAALAELQPIARKLERDGQLQPFAPQEIERATRLIVTSSAPGATVSLDGDKTPQAAPLIVEIAPGRHKIHLAAKNHFGEDREIEVAGGAVTALDLPLREMPATLTLTAIAGARVSLDGRFAGETPLPGPLELPAGRHEVQFQKPGYTSYSIPLEVGPGEKTTVAAPLVLTFQRKVSIGLLAGGGAAVAGGLVLGGLALAQQAEASTLKGDMDQGKVVCRGEECPELDRYNSALSARDTLRAGAFTLAGVGAVAAGAGLFFYLVDDAWPFSRARSDGAPRPAAPTVAAVPVVAPGFGGVALSGQF